MKKVLFIFAMIFFTSFCLKSFASDNFNTRSNKFTISSTGFNTTGNNVNFGLSNRENLQLLYKLNDPNKSFNKLNFKKPLMTHNINPLDIKFSAYNASSSTKRADPFTRTLIGACAGLVAAALIGGENVSGGALIAGTAIGGVFGFVVWQVSTDDIDNMFN